MCSKESGLEVKAKGKVMCSDQNAGRSHSTKIENSSFERVEDFKYLGRTQQIKILFRKKFKSRLKSRNAFYYSVQNFLSTSLLSKNLKIKIYRNIILPKVLYGCKIWSLTLREELRLTAFVNRVLRRIFGSKRDEITGEWETNPHNEELNDLNTSPIVVQVIKSRKKSVCGHVACMGESRGYTWFWWETCGKGTTWKTQV